MRSQSFVYFLLGCFLTCALCVAQTTTNQLTQEENQIIASVGIPLDSKMVTELTAMEISKLKPIIKDKPVAEIKSFLVTRYFVRQAARSGDLPDLDKTEIVLLQENLDLHYCYDMFEGLGVLNMALYYSGKYDLHFKRPLNLEDMPIK